MSTHLQKLVKYLSEGDYQPVKGYNIINPSTHCIHEVADCDCPCKHETPECTCQTAECDCQEITKQKGEHVTSSGAQDWMTPDEGHAGKFGMKKPGLQPYTSLVRRVGKVPYFATRWRKTEVKGLPAEVKIIPVDNYTGDLEQVYESWELYVDEKDEREDTKDLLLPLLGLQEFIKEDRKGILAQLGNRIIGLVSIMVDELGEARISILTASPKEIEDGKEEYVEDALREGLETYASSREWNLLHSHKEDMENLARQASLKKNYRIEKGKVKTQRDAKILAEKQAMAVKMKEAGRVPRTGDWLAPGRGGWIKPEEYVEQMGGGKKGEKALEALQNKGGAQGSFDPIKRRRGPTTMRKYDPKDINFDVEWSEGMTLADGTRYDNTLRDATEIHLSKLPDAKHQGWYRDKNGLQITIRSMGYKQSKQDAKWLRNNVLATKMPAVMDNLRGGVAAGDQNAEALLFIAVTGMRLGDESELTGTKGQVKNEETGEMEEQILPTYGASTILGKHIALDGDDIYIFAPLKTTNREKHAGEAVTKLPKINNKELADMLRSKGAAELVKNEDGTTKGIKKVGKNSAGVGINQGTMFPKTNADSIQDYMENWVTGPGGLDLPKDAEGKGFTPKDLRTLTGRVTLGASMDRLGVPTTQEEYNEFKSKAIADVAKVLGNTSKVAERSYIDPVLFDVWPDQDDLPSERFSPMGAEVDFDDWDNLDYNADDDDEGGADPYSASWER